MRKIDFKRSALLAVVVLAFSAVSIFGLPGDLDPTFGSGGVVSLQNSWPSSVILLSDGKMLVNGDGIKRFLPNGEIDRTFGLDGSAVLPPDAWGYFPALAIQPDGKILVGGFQYFGLNHYFTVMRLNPNGTLDVSFGTDGRSITPMGSGYDYLNDITVQSDGKIVAVGTSRGFAVARYNSDGSLDNSFGTDGKVITRLSERFDDARSASVQDDGKIVIAGTSDNDTNLSVVRLRNDGSLDTGFAQDGIFEARSDEGFGWDPAMALRPGGGIVLAGCRRNAGDFDFTLFGITEFGAADENFGNGGMLNTDLGGNSDCIRAVQIQQDGKMIAAGQAGGFGGSSFAVVRYMLDGSLDPTFGTGGIVATDLSPDNDISTSIAIQPDGRIVATGITDWIDYSDDYANLAIVRYQNNLTAPTVTVSGRVLSPAGAAIRNVSVSLIDPAGVRRTVSTSTFGIFTFDAVSVGREYRLIANSKRFRFAPQTIFLTENLSGLSLIAAE